jgi:anti-sigma factor RsiW
MMRCSDAVQRLWQYLEDELSVSDRALVEEHLAFCRRCCGEVEFAEELRRFMADAARPHLPAEVELRLTGFLQELEGLARLDPEEAP